MIQTVRPENRREFMNKLVIPYDPKTGNPNSVFSEPTKLGQPENNRAKEISLKGDTDKDFYVGIKDIDEALMHYFSKVLRLSVIQNNTRVEVPILYGTPENWKGVQKDGYYRDSNGKLLWPLLMFKRDTITQNRGLGYKLDGNMVHNVQLFERGFNRRNAYGNFTVLNNRVPEKSYSVVVTPDYITVEYECIVWTYTVEQMDKLIEELNFASRSYWGDPNRFQFYSSIETFSDSITYDVGADRAVKCSFTLTLNGYLIPDSINKKLIDANRYHGVSNIIFSLETSSGTEQFATKVAKAKAGNRSVLTTDSANVVVNVTQNLGPDTISYLSRNASVTGTYVSPTTVRFTGAFMIPPANFPANGIDNFNFFNNSTYIEKTSIVSFIDSGVGYCTLTVDTGSLGYSFDASDLVTAVGKFA